MPAQTKPKLFESRRNFFFPGADSSVWCLRPLCCVHSLVCTDAPGTAFRHLPPNSARFGYATEGALFISAQLSTDAVSALQKVWVLIWL